MRLVAEASCEQVSSCGNAGSLEALASDPRSLVRLTIRAACDLRSKGSIPLVTAMTPKTFVS